MAYELLGKTHTAVVEMVVGRASSDLVGYPLQPSSHLHLGTVALRVINGSDLLRCDKCIDVALGERNLGPVLLSEDLALGTGSR